MKDEEIIPARVVEETVEVIPWEESMLRRMADAEDEHGGRISVGGLAVDAGLYVARLSSLASAREKALEEALREGAGVR